LTNCFHTASQEIYHFTIISQCFS